MDTDNVLNQVLKGTIYVQKCRDRIVNIQGITPSGGAATLCVIKWAYRPSNYIPCQIMEAASVDKGKAEIYIDTAGQIVLRTSSDLQYGIYYNVCYII